MIKKVMKMYPWVLGLVLVLMWSCVYCVKGYVGAGAWTLLKLVLGPIGCLLLIVNIIVLAHACYKKRVRKSMVVALGLHMVWAYPVLLLLGVVQVAYPIDLATTGSGLEIRSPFMQEAYVGWGGDAVEGNQPHAIWASERWAYDLLMPPYDIESQTLSDYGIYGAEIYAPIKARVIGLYDREEDILPHTEDFRSMAGNYIYLKVEDTATYLLFNHLLKDSIDLEVGDYVEPGDYLGRVGNTGATSEPHLHIHHQKQNPLKTIFPTVAEGLPLYFIDGVGKPYMPIRGDTLKGRGIDP